MKNFVYLILAISVLAGSTAIADGEYIGPAFKTYDEDACGLIGAGYEYWGDRKTLHSNGRTGHATVKCKMELVAGEAFIGSGEGESGSFPLGGDATCYTSWSAEGNKATWTSQCFNAWDSGD